MTWYINTSVSSGVIDIGDGDEKDWLISEVKRLRGLIEKHKEKMKDIESAVDTELYEGLKRGEDR